MAARAEPSLSIQWLRALERTAAIVPESRRTLPVIVEEIALVSPDAVALSDVDDTLTYRALAATIRRVSRWATTQGLRPGDRVALRMGNRSAYPALWLGLSRVGIVTALLNTQLTGHSLAHALKVSQPRLVVADVGGLQALGAIDIGDAALWGWASTAQGIADLADAIGLLDDGPLTAAEAPEIRLRDPALLVYTSGTTGLPKAARVSHHRVAMWSEWFAAITEARPDDRLYDCLPMYHSVGGIVAVGTMLVSGGAVIVREGFSGSRFWADVADSGATIFQYVGELCRYLLRAAGAETKGAHRLRLCCGNGLRADVWTAFAERFAIPRVLEFYAATEGSFSLFNLEGKPGAIGRVPGFMAHRSPVALVRHDPDTAEPVRDGDGFCLRCGVDEPGEAIGRLGDDGGGLSGRFEGYTDEADSEKKVLRDVFAPGDRWFRTGDLMRRDAKGFFVFVDRVGDTFRWKGENVSAAEVEATLRSCPGNDAAVVYGVAVPGADGRAGMAAIVTRPDFSFAALEGASRSLPRYARPLFVRLCAGVATTGTFKPKKADLVADGYDMARTDDPLYLLSGGRYRRLDADLSADLAAADRTLLRSL